MLSKIKTIGFILLLGPALSVGFAGIDFARQIQPILSETCYQCHGPSDTSRKGGLRLDTREGAHGSGKSGRLAITPGNLSASELIRRITTSDADDHMPPADSHKSLTTGQIDLLRRWVAEGGKWGVHWSFSPPSLPAIPKVRSLRKNHPIDAFVAASLAGFKKKLTQNADPKRLLRRVSFDLTGLPPTVNELASFEANPTPENYLESVKRLMASPRYGEHMAVGWLDLARFADTHGFQTDRYRPVWPWRDWVIGAFNQQLSFDQFVVWQLAGDLFPNPSKEQRLATTFNRLHLQNEEGGIVEEEYRVAYNVDRVNTFGTAFLGVTFECARCHDHKYDPISQREFYQLFSFFQNVDESGQSVYFGDIMPVPTTLLSSAEQDTKLAELQQRISAQEIEVKRIATNAQTEFATWRSTNTTGPTLAKPVAAFTFDSMVSNIFPSSTAGKVAKPIDNPSSVDGYSGKALSLNGENGVSMPGIGHFTRADPFSLALWIQPAVHTLRQTVIHHSQAWMDAGSRGYEIVLEEGRVAVGLHHMWPGNSLKIQSIDGLPLHTWSHVAFAYDGSSRAQGLTLFINGLPVPVKILRDHLWKDITYGQPDLTVGLRMRDFGFKGGKVDELQVFDSALTAVEAARFAKVPPPSVPETELAHFIARDYPPYTTALATLRKLRQEQNGLVTSIQDIMVMEEMDEPKPAYILKRGAYDAPGERVSMNTPAAMGTLSPSAPRNRLGLARWLLEPSNPLFARVTVNRVWQHFFGRGLVETSDNFGLQGALPTHPELLDWLAVTFAQGNPELRIRPWNLQDLQRLIVTSDTYCQTSRASKSDLADDPMNLKLGRGPTRRLTAEMLRDQALFTSGLLIEKIGGPSVKPYQPDGLWEMASGGRYDTGKGGDLYRRSLYTYWKRTIPPPSMMSFDAADRSYCVVRRQSTSTPLQALALLNDTQIVEASRHLANRILKEGGTTPTQQLRSGFQWITGRPPKPSETVILKQLLAEQESLFEGDTASADLLLKVGEKSTDGVHPSTKLAAWTLVAEALLNHDEAVMLR